MTSARRYPVVDRRDYEGSWHLDKKFSIGIILAILFQCSCFVWYGAQLDAEIKAHGEKLGDLVAWRAKQDDAQTKIDSHLAVADEKLAEQAQILTHIDERLEKIMMKK